MKELQEFIGLIKNGFDTNSFIKTTFSKPKKKDTELVNVYTKIILLKNIPHLSFTYRHQTNDITKNFLFEDALVEINRLLTEDFNIITYFCKEADYSLNIAKPTKVVIQKLKPSLTSSESLSHDRPKQKRATHSPYLYALGVTDTNGNVIPKMADKYKQINKYLEIVENLITTTNLPKQVNVVDMGSGKGYLTFALYDYLKNKLNLDITITGIELRQELVDYCAKIAKECSFDKLQFVCQPIETYHPSQIDILIALHACDTATDDAIFKGISSEASLIICAPCCHKQIRQQVKGIKQENPVLQYGIFQEREFEMVTDTIRALILENHQYESNIFEFISNEHTRKNILLVGKKNKTKSIDKSIPTKLKQLKAQYHIQKHYLETLITKG